MGWFSSNDSEQQRAALVARLRDAGYVTQDRVADAIGKVPREAFLDATNARFAYEDHPVPIGWDQTISAPHMVALMCEALDLQPGLRVLEIGTGSGYHAAVVARLVAPGGSVVSVERLEPLVERARRILDHLGLTHVTVLEGDGSQGHPAGAPYDRIYLTCSAPTVPPPLLAQLGLNGVLLAPVGEAPSRLVRIRRAGDQWKEEDLGACAFVPLRGEFGFT